MPLTARPTLRLLIAMMALVQAFVPGIASITDAAPAAQGISQRFAPHVEREGASHTSRAHMDNCALCRLVLRGTAERPTAEQPGADRVRLPRAERREIAPQLKLARWTAPSRAPPLD